MGFHRKPGAIQWRSGHRNGPSSGACLALCFGDWYAVATQDGTLGDSQRHESDCRNCGVARPTIHRSGNCRKPARRDSIGRRGHPRRIRSLVRQRRHRRTARRAADPRAGRADGPIRERIGLNSGFGVFGPGYRANATIGPALRLLMINVGGARPGEISMSTFGHPGRYTFCIGENEEASPWPAFHTSRGLPASASAATLFAGDATRDLGSRQPHSA
jgi:hypothetical protein